MERADKVIRRISSSSILPQDAFPGIPVVEIAGMGRVLIEGHKGVTEYGPQRIQVTMNYGSLLVIGCDLSLAHMSKERLVIVGSVNQVCLYRG